MNTSVPNKIFKLILVLFAAISATALNAQSGSGGVSGSGDPDDIQEIPELVFKNAALLSGTDGKEGAVYLFKNVTTGFDATIKLKKFSSPDIYMKTVDNTSFGWDKAFQPEFGMNSVKPNQNWYIDFELTFLEAGTTKKKKADRFTLTSLDVDGDNSNVKEYVVMEKATSVTYSTISYLTGAVNTILPTCCECDKQSAVIACLKCLGTGKNGKKKCKDCDGVGKIYSLCKHSYCGEDASIQGPVDNFSNIDTASTSVMATYVYNNKDAINFRIGAVSGNKTGGAGIRLNSLWFRAFSLAPVGVLPVRLENFNALYDQTNVNLAWATAREENFSHFVIERSTDGKTYAEAAVVFSMGGLDGAYAFKDKNVQSSTGVIYYRLKSIDKSGEVNYSNVRVIRLTKEELKGLALSTYPNPVMNQLRVTVPANWQGKAVKLEVMSSNGILVKAAQFSSSSQTETVDFANVGKGFYVIRAICGNETAQQQVIKN